MVDPKLQLVGGGRMGQALLGGLLRTGWAKPHELAVVEVDESKREELSASLPEVLVVAAPFPGIDTLLAVKPHIVSAVCAQLDQPGRVMSIAAGITIGAMQQILGSDVAVLRVMPNTPALVGQGVSAVAAGSSATDADLEWASKIMSSVGLVVTVPESQLDAVTGLSGSGPAYVFAVAEALVEAGKAAGLEQEIAETLAFQTLYGSACLLHESKSGPAQLRSQVTTPGGTTAAGLAVLATGLEELFVEAVKAAKQRSIELGAASDSAGSTQAATSGPSGKS